MLPLRIIDQDFKLLAEIDLYNSLQTERSAYGIGVFEMRINRYIKHTEQLQMNNIVFPVNQTHKPFIIRHKEIELDENGKATENWLIRGYQLKSIVANRLIYPTTGQLYNSVEGNAETVLKHLVNTQMVNPQMVSRVYENLIIAPNQQRGNAIRVDARYENLAEKISELAFLNEIAWDITLDYENKKFVFDVSEGLDRTINQSNIPPVQFSTDFETLKSMSYTESELDYKNVAIVIGSGEGMEQQKIEVGNASGRNRYELLVETSSIDTEMEVEGANALKEVEQTTFCDGQVLSKSIFKYEQDYNLMDRVTLHNKDWGVMMHPRITSVKEIEEPNKHGEIELVFDNNRPTLLKKIKSEIATVKKSVK